MLNSNNNMRVNIIRPKAEALKASSVVTRWSHTFPFTVHSSA